MSPVVSSRPALQRDLATDVAHRKNAAEWVMYFFLRWLPRNVCRPFGKR